MSIETYISEFSKYVIAGTAVLYALDCLLYFLIRKEENRRVIYLWQNMLIFAFHFSSFMVLCFETKEVSLLIFYAIQQVTLYVVMVLYRYLYPKSNRFIVNNMCMCLSVSFVMLTRLDYQKAVRQFIIASICLVIALLIPFFVRSLRVIRNLKWIYAAAGVALLGIVLILGQTTYGSRISYTIAGATFQPAEFVKIIFVFYVASALYDSHGIFDVFTTAVIAGLHVLIQVVNRDLGSALIFFVIYICMVYVATGHLIYLILGLAGGAGAAYLAYGAYAHVQSRVTAWLDPFSVIDKAGYQITQSLFGISSGGFFGLGLMKGAPESIPFVEDDFIFSSIAEELGIVFAVCLILICLATFVAIMKVAYSLTDRFYQLIAFGLGVAYIFQVFLTIGGGTKFIPLTGITLPLVSYGGSSVLTTLIMFAIVEGLCIVREDEVSEEGAQGKPDRKTRGKSDKKRDKKKDRKKDRKKDEKRDRDRRRKEREEESGSFSRRRERYEDTVYEEDYGDDPYEERRREEEERKLSRVSRASRRPYAPYGTGSYAEAGHGRASSSGYERRQRPVYRDETERDNTYRDHAGPEEEAPDEDLEFLHGYTVKIPGDQVEEELGRIYYNEEEYEKDRRNEREKAQKE